MIHWFCTWFLKRVKYPYWNESIVYKQSVELNRVDAVGAGIELRERHRRHRPCPFLSHANQVTLLFA